MSINYNIGKGGDINTKEGLILYLYDKEKIGHIKLYSFDFLEIVYNELYKNLPEDLELNYENTIICLDFFVNKEFRNKGIGKKLLDLSLSESKKLNVDYWVGCRDKDNGLSKNVLESINPEKIIESKKIFIYIKKV
jgi:GNAT superfamily N-acetyltransferase